METLTHGIPYPPPRNFLILCPFVTYSCICLSFDVQKFLADRTYYIVKELLMTERTYKKDLEVITVVC